MPPGRQNTYAELMKALELGHGDHLRDMYYAQLRWRRQRSGESLQEFEAKSWQTKQDVVGQKKNVLDLQEIEKIVNGIDCFKTRKIC